MSTALNNRRTLFFIFVCVGSAGSQQDTTAGGLQAAWVKVAMPVVLGAGSTSAVPPSTHIKNANQPRPGP